MLSQIDSLILDMDGVLWHGDSPMPGLVHFFATLRQQDIDYVLATNNASRLASDYTHKLASFGVEVAPDRILTSGEATADYLSRRYEPGTVAYAVGEEALRQTLRAHGFVVLPPEAIFEGETAALVVAGYTRHLTYGELAMGSLLVTRGASFYGTNPDVSVPSELGPLPGAGAIQAAIIAATGVTPTVIGKPGPILFAEALRRLGTEASRTAMVGDRLSTDIAGGNAAGLHTILLLSGISSRRDADTSEIRPDLVLADIAALAEALSAARSVSLASGHHA